MLDSNYFTTSLNGAIYIQGNNSLSMDRCVVPSIGYSYGSGILVVGLREQL